MNTATPQQIKNSHLTTQMRLWVRQNVKKASIFMGTTKADLIKFNDESINRFVISNVIPGQMFVAVFVCARDEEIKFGPEEFNQHFPQCTIELFDEVTAIDEIIFNLFFVVEMAVLGGTFKIQQVKELNPRVLAKWILFCHNFVSDCKIVGNYIVNPQGNVNVIRAQIKSIPPSVISPEELKERHLDLLGIAQNFPSRKHFVFITFGPLNLLALRAALALKDLTDCVWCTPPVTPGTFVTSIVMVFSTPQRELYVVNFLRSLGIASHVSQSMRYGGLSDFNDLLYSAIRNDRVASDFIKPFVTRQVAAMFLKDHYLLQGRVFGNEDLQQKLDREFPSGVRVISTTPQVPIFTAEPPIPPPAPVLAAKPLPADVGMPAFELSQPALLHPLNPPPRKIAAISPLKPWELVLPPLKSRNLVLPPLRLATAFGEPATIPTERTAFDSPVGCKRGAGDA